MVELATTTETTTGTDTSRAVTPAGVKAAVDPIRDITDETFSNNLAASIGALAALVVDMDGNPLGTGHVVIKVDTANGNEINDIVWVGSI